MIFPDLCGFWKEVSRVVTPSPVTTRDIPFRYRETGLTTRGFPFRRAPHHAQVAQNLSGRLVRRATMVVFLYKSSAHDACQRSEASSPQLERQREPDASPTWAGGTAAIRAAGWRTAHVGRLPAAFPNSPVAESSPRLPVDRRQSRRECITIETTAHGPPWLPDSVGADSKGREGRWA